MIDSVVLAIGFILAVTAALVGHRKPKTLVAATVIYSVMVAMGIDAPFTLAGISIYSGDLIVLVLIIVTARQPRQRTNASLLLVAGITLLLLASAIRGALEFGLQPAGNEARGFIYFVAAVVTFARTPPSRAVSTLYRFLASCSILFLLLAILRWSQVSSNLWTDAALEEMTTANAYRVLGAAETMVIAQTILLASSLVLVGISTPIHPLAIAIGLLSVVILQHRSVWISTILGFCALALRTARKGAWAWLSLLGVAALLATLAYLIMPAATETIGAALHNWVLEPLEERSSLEWRVEGWEELLGELRASDATEWVVGNPLGRGYDRYLRGGLVSVTPHNFFLQILLRSGLTGLALFLALYGRLIYRSAKVDRPTGLLALALLFAQMAYFIPYGATLSQGVVTGLLISMLERTEPSRANHSLTRRGAL